MILKHKAKRVDTGEWVEGWLYYDTDESDLSQPYPHIHTNKQWTYESYFTVHPDTVSPVWPELEWENYESEVYKMGKEEYVYHIADGYLLLYIGFTGAGWHEYHLHSGGTNYLKEFAQSHFEELLINLLTPKS